MCGSSLLKPLLGREFRTLSITPIEGMNCFACSLPGVVLTAIMVSNAVFL
jgi:hypothetical protein